MAIMAPSGGPTKTGDLQGKAPVFGGPCPLGAAMDSSALADTRSTAPTGARPSPTITASARSPRSRAGCGKRGPRTPSWPPLPTPGKSPVCRGNRSRGSKSSPFGGSHALVWLSRTNRGRSSGSVAPRSRASREPAFVPGARCNSSRPHGRGRDQHPRVADDRWHTNASRRVLRHGGRWQLPTGGGNGRARSEGRRDVGPAARRAGTTYPSE